MICGRKRRFLLFQKIHIESYIILQTICGVITFTFHVKLSYPLFEFRHFHRELIYQKL